jgi:hypothetical protein
LTKIDAAQKAKAIREVKAIMTGMNLVEVSLPHQPFLSSFSLSTSQRDELTSSIVEHFSG